MRYGSVCSGIEAATVAWHPLGWEPAFFSEIESFPREVLSYHYPNTPLHGDFTTIGSDDYGTIDLLVGGTPCQSFSIAGLRGGLDDDRGNLALEFLRLAQRKRPTWLVWENVPGVLSSNGGRDFGSILGGLVELGYGFAYRVLDAQYFGVAQRRRRVFVVGYLGDWRPAAAVLFERQSLRGDSAPRREKRQTAPTIPARSTGGGGLGTDFDCDGGSIVVGALATNTGPNGHDAGNFACNQAVDAGHVIPSTTKQWPADVAATMNTRFADKMGLEDQHAFGGASYFVPDTLGTMTARMFNALGSRDVEEGAVIPVSFDAYNQQVTPNISKPVTSRDDQDTASCIAFMAKDHGADATEELCPTLRAGGHNTSHSNSGNWPAIAFQSNGNTDDILAAGHEVSPTVRGGGQGGNPPAVAFPINTQIAMRHEAMGEGTGMGIGSETDPAFTLQAGHSHAVAVRTANTNANGHGIADEVAHTLDQAQGQAVVSQPYTLAIRGRGDGRDLEYRDDGTSNALLTPNGGRDGIGVGAVAFSVMPMNSGKDYKARETEVAQPIMANGPVGGNQGGDYVVAFAQNQRDEVRAMEVSGALAAEPGMKQQTYVATHDVAGTMKACAQSGGFSNSADHAAAGYMALQPPHSMAVRRLTPRECERLQGFPDDYTLIPVTRHTTGCALLVSDEFDAVCDCGKPLKMSADGPRYKALGNSMAVPVMAWIGRRIQMVEDILK